LGLPSNSLRLTHSAICDRTEYDLTLVNTPNGIERKIDIPSATLRWKGKTITTIPINNIGLNEREASIKLNFNKTLMPASGVYEGKLVVKDKERPDLTKTFRLNLKGNYKPVLEPSLAIIAGAIISLLLSVFFPRKIRKKKMAQRLFHLNKDMENQMAGYGRAGSGPSTRFLAKSMWRDLARLRHLFGEINILSPMVSERFTNVEGLIEDLTKRLNQVKEIDRLREVAWNRQSIPFSMRRKLAEELNAAEWNLVVEKTDNTKSHINTAWKMIEDETAIMAQRTSLAQQIAERLPPPAPGAATDLTDDPWIFPLIQELRRYAHLAEVPEERLVELDRKYTIVTNFLDSFEELQRSYPTNVSQNKVKLVEYLKTGVNDDSDLKKSLDKVRQLRMGVAINHVVDAANQQKGQIILEPKNPTAGVLVRARFQFDDGRIDREPDLTFQLIYEWNFGDDTESTSGKDAVHFYDEKKEGATCNLTLTIRYGEPNPQELCKMTKKIKVQKAPSPSLDLTLMQSSLFFGTVVVALLVGLNVQLDSITAYDSWQDYLAPFLWGFGLDQAKTGFSSSMDTLEKQQLRVA